MNKKKNLWVFLYLTDIVLKVHILVLQYFSVQLITFLLTVPAARDVIDCCPWVAEN